MRFFLNFSSNAPLQMNTIARKVSVFRLYIAKNEDFIMAIIWKIILLTNDNLSI